jgi:PRTRC genetic system protein A
MFKIIQGIPEDKSGLGLITYALCEDGTYLIRAAGCGHIVTKVDGINGMPKGKESISILRRKIPISAFWETLRFFREVENQHKDKALEAYVLVMYNRDTDKYFLYVPEQVVGAASAHYDVKEVWSKFPNCSIVIDIHSHTSSMGAFFSSTDNKDDNRDRYSAVIGKINNVIPEFKVRFSTLGKRVNVDIDSIFCESNEKLSIDVTSSIKNITIAKEEEAKGFIPVGSGAWNSGWNGHIIARSGYSNLWNNVRDRVIGD